MDDLHSIIFYICIINIPTHVKKNVMYIRGIPVFSVIPSEAIAHVTTTVGHYRVSNSWKVLRTAVSIQSPACNRGGPVSIPDYLMWNFWWKKWRCDRVFSEHAGFLLSVSFHLCSVVVHHRRYIILVGNN